MRTFKAAPINGNFMVYIVSDDGKDTNCFSIKHYEANKDKYKDKVLIIAHESVPVYFRKG